MKVLITGAAGFIGFHLAQRLLSLGWEVIGLDNMNDYYDVSLKRARLSLLGENKRFFFSPNDVSDTSALEKVFADHPLEIVIHLAAQPGVRHSLTHPETYVHSNLLGFAAILEASRKQGIRHFYYASSSSVYGKQTPVPFSEEAGTDQPSSLYAATKKSNELIAYAYSESFGLPTTGLRFFSVYGPWGRPDMAYFSFTRDILNGNPISVHNEGHMRRDFTFINDVVESVVRLMLASASGHSSPGYSAPYRIFNIGSSRPVELISFIRILENLLGRRAVLEMKPMQPGEVPETYADTRLLQEIIGYRPETPLEQGLGDFVRWYRKYNTV